MTMVFHKDMTNNNKKNNTHTHTTTNNNNNNNNKEFSCVPIEKMAGLKKLIHSEKVWLF